jgi:hypothetical protein
MPSVSPINPAIPRCPRCRAKAVIKKGTRPTRHEARQRWGCTRCGHTFTNLVTKHSPYPVKVIMEALCRYNLGYSARETVRYLKGRFRIAVPEKTFRLWYTAHKPICTYHTIRDQIKRRFEPSGLIEKHYLQHRQVYRYTLHHGKLDHLFAYPYHRAYEPMRAYLASITSREFPHHLFTPDIPVRSSTYPVRLSATVTRKENYATRLAALALQIAPNNKKQHETLQRFVRRIGGMEECCVLQPGLLGISCTHPTHPCLIGSQIPKGRGECSMSGHGVRGPSYLAPPRQRKVCRVKARLPEPQFSRSYAGRHRRVAETMSWRVRRAIKRLA